MGLKHREIEIDQHSQIKDDDPGSYYERKEAEAEAWRKLLLHAQHLQAPDSVVAVIRRQLELAEYVGD